MSGPHPPRPVTPQDDRPERPWIVLLAINLALAIPFVILLASNTDSVGVSWLGIEWRWPLFVVILVAFVTGALIDEIVGIWWRIHRRRQDRLTRELDELRRRSLRSDT